MGSGAWWPNESWSASSSLVACIAPVCAWPAALWYRTVPRTYCATLVHDYTTYHAVLVIEGSPFKLMLIALSLYCWRQWTRAPAAEARLWTFEKKAYGCFGLYLSPSMQ